MFFKKKREDIYEDGPVVYLDFRDGNKKKNKLYNRMIDIMLIDRNEEQLKKSFENEQAIEHLTEAMKYLSETMWKVGESANDAAESLRIPPRTM